MQQAANPPMILNIQANAGPPGEKVNLAIIRLSVVLSGSKLEHIQINLEMGNPEIEFINLRFFI